jgi:hypothetical protein
MDLGSNCDVWKSCIVGYVAGKSPGFRYLNNIISNTLNYEATLSVHDLGWLIYQFNKVEDKFAILSRGLYLVFRRPHILRPIPQFFNFSAEEMFRVPVWVKFPNLPLKCWTPNCLSKFANMFGKPLQSDRLTSTMARLSYARVLVEVNLIDVLPSSIKVILPNGSTLNKKVVYETMPRFCKLCQVLSHSTTACPSAGSKLAPQGSGETESRNRGSALQRLDPTGDQVVRNIETI